MSKQDLRAKAAALRLNNDLTKTLAGGSSSDPELASAMLDAVQDLPAGEIELIDSLIVHLANLGRIGMHGRQVRDHLGIAKPAPGAADDPKAQRAAYTISPYNLPSANAVVSAFWTDAENGETWVLLGRRNARWRDPASGLSSVAVLPGGFMDPAPRDGALPGARHDMNLDETAARELREETGLIAPPVGPRFRQIQTRSQFYPQSEGQVHMIFADYAADFSGTPSPPAAKGQDDIAAVYWVRVRDLQRLDQPAPDPGRWDGSRYRLTINGEACSLYDPHGAALEVTLRAHRDQRLKAIAGMDAEGLQQVARRMESRQGRRPGTYLPPHPGVEVGPEAEAWTAEATHFARRLSRRLDHIARDWEQPAPPKDAARPVPAPARQEPQAPGPRSFP